MLPTSWELASLLCKILLYTGAASIAGGSLCLWQFSDRSRLSVYHNLSYMMLGSILGFQAVLINFFLQVGQVSGSGIIGMFDWGMISILLDTSLGEVTFYRLAAFVWALLATLLYLRKLKFRMQPFSQLEYQRLIMTYAIPFMVIAMTFRLSGHVSVLPVTAQVAVVLHFTAFALWIGALYPLLLLSGSQDIEILRTGMRRFGNAAIGLLIVLFAAGVLMALQLIGAWVELITTPYGLGLLTKLFLVSLLLGIAAVNKMILVPRINSQVGVTQLARSIRIEMLAATLVLTATAYFSTLVGPVEH